MAFRSEKRKSFIVFDDSSDSDSCIPFYGEKQLKRTNEVKTSLQMLCDNDSSTDEKSNSRPKSIKEKNNSVTGTTIIDKNTNYKNTNKNTCHANVKAFIESERKHNKREESVCIDNDLDEVFCDPSVPSVHSKQTPPNVNKHSNRNNEVEVTDTNFKPHIMKMTKELKYILAKFKLEIHYLQLKYLQDKIVTKQDAKDIMSTYNSIINRLKEEVIAQQQNSMNSYHQWGETIEAHSQSSSDSEILSASYNRRKVTKKATNNVSCLDNKNVTLQPNVKNNANKQPLEIDSTSAVTVKKNNNYNNTASKSNQSLPPLLYRLKEVNVIRKSVKTPVTDSRITEHTAPNVDALNQELKKTIGRHDAVKQDSLRNGSVKEKGLLPDYDSDVNSTCSTIAFYSSKKKNVPISDSDQDDLIDADMDRDRNTLNKTPPDVILMDEEENDKIQFTNLYHYDSDATVIISRNNITDSTARNSKHRSKDHILTKGETVSISSNNENISSEQRSEFVVPGVNNLSTKYRLKSVAVSNRADSVPNSKPTKHNQYNAGVDEKLRMNCQVLIEKFKITTR